MVTQTIAEFIEKSVTGGRGFHDSVVSLEMTELDRKNNRCPASKALDRLPEGYEKNVLRRNIGQNDSGLPASIRHFPVGKQGRDDERYNTQWSLQQRLLNMALEDGEPLYGTALEMVPIEGPIPEGAFQMPNRAAYFTSKQVELDKRVVEKVFDSVSPSQAKTLEDRNWSSGKNTVGRVGRLFNEAYNFVQGRPSKIRKLMEQGDLYKNIEPEIVDAMIDEINPERISTSYADLGLGKLNLGSL